jgi:hypothetical protein
MVAAEITPTIVQKEYVPCIGKTGTPMRIVKYFFKLTKATQADWILTTTMQTGTPIYWNACVIDSSSDGVSEVTGGITYTSTGTKLTFAGATVGTTTGEVWFTE